MTELCEVPESVCSIQTVSSRRAGDGRLDFPVRFADLRPGVEAGRARVQSDDGRLSPADREFCK